MATWAERQQVLEGLDKEGWQKLTECIGGINLDRPPEKRITPLLVAADQPGSSDEYDRAFGLPTTGEQQLQLQKDSVKAAKSSGLAAWLSAGCALLALVLSIIAICVSTSK